VDRLRFVGVALAKTRLGWHLGILHRKAGQPAAILHLARDRVLCNEAPREAYSWVQLRLPEARLRALAAHCRRIWERNGASNLRYAFRYEGAAFDAAGELELTPDTNGLSCATFVLAAFQSLGVRLLAFEDWPPANDEDLSGREQIIALLCHRNGDPAWRNVLQGELRSPRFHPIEVVAATLRAPEACPTPWRTATLGRCELEGTLRVRCVPLLT